MNELEELKKEMLKGSDTIFYNAYGKTFKIQRKFFGTSVERLHISYWVYVQNEIPILKHKYYTHIEFEPIFTIEEAKKRIDKYYPFIKYERNYYPILIK